MSFSGEESNIDHILADQYEMRSVSAYNIAIRHRAAGVANLERYPNAVVVDLEKELETFFDQTSVAHEYELDKSETLREVLLYIANSKDALTDGIPSLGQDILLIHSRECGFKDGEKIAKATMEFGTAIFNKFQQLGMYTPEGLLPYELGKWVDSTSPCLIKSKDVG